MHRTRSEAKAAGDKHYFTGEPCVRGHVAKRFTSIGKCSLCGLEDAARKYREKHSGPYRVRTKWTTETIVKAFEKKHGSRYDYSRVEYGKMKTKVRVVCPFHGDFQITPDNHMAGKGCPKCADVATGERCRKTQEAFLAQVKAKWGDRYDFSEAKYVDSKTPVKGICSVHGEFWQVADGVMNSWSIGCKGCAAHASQEEERIYRFVSLFEPAVHRCRQTIPPREIDVLVPGRKVAIEYCGMYYHSVFNPDQKDRKTRHRYKYDRCQEQGLRLLTIYESEWLARPATIRRIIRRAIGADRGRVFARKCILRRVSSEEATVFFERYHLQGGGGTGQHWGLDYKGKLVACMRFSKGTTARGRAADKAAWELSRYATRVRVVGGAAKLFQAFLAAERPHTVKSFSDNRYFTGEMYAALGFRLDGEVPPDYAVWSQKLGLRHKSAYQRKHLSTRLAEHGIEEQFDPLTDPRSEREVLELMRAGRIYDCGKKRWIYETTI